MNKRVCENIADLQKHALDRLPLDAARGEGEDVKSVPAHVRGRSIYAGVDNWTVGISI